MRMFVRNKEIGLALILFAILLSSFAGNKAYKVSRNDRSSIDTGRMQPVIPGDLADPSVIRVGSDYYATGTSSEWAPHYPLFKSTDLIHWKHIGYVFNQTPEWASSSFWAPELLYRNGTYYVYYTARKKSDGISCIGVATSTDPEKGFTGKGIVLEFGREAIDAFVIKDKDKWYITFKAYGLDQRPIELLGYQLSDDGLKTVGTSFMLLRDDEKIGLEGQCIIKRNNYFYLIYSAGGCCGVQCSYHVNIARSKNLKGPYEKYDGNPILDAFDEWKCTGHGTVVTSESGEDYYLYHAYNKRNDVYTGRQGMLTKISWNRKAGWPSLQPISGAVVDEAFNDMFNDSVLNKAWQWDFRHAQPQVKLNNGQLILSGAVKSENLTGTALTVRPFKADYEIYTTVVNRNQALKGLTVYGDADRSIGIGVRNDTVEVWSVHDKNCNILATEGVGEAKSIHLKISVRDGNRFQFYWGVQNNNWREIHLPDSDDKIPLPPWDRSPRPGLLQKGEEPAVFDAFRMTYF